jgi:glutamate mutase epsilon subunit
MQIKAYNSPDNVVMYALDKKGWRDVRINTIIEWYEGMPKEESK